MKKKKKVIVSVSKLVAEHFLPRPKKGQIALHIGDIRDDRVENLRYGTIDDQWQIVADRKRETDKAIEYKGKRYASYKELARTHGINYSTWRNRIKGGWEFDEALEIPTERKHKTLKVRLFPYQGKSYTAQDIADMTGIGIGGINQRIRYRWSISEIIEIPPRKGAKLWNTDMIKKETVAKNTTNK